MDNSATDKCPLCGEPNHCAATVGESPQHCWCMGADLASQVLAAIPLEDRGVRCVCPRCGHYYSEGANSER